MRQARRQMLPPLPSTLSELGEYLDLNVNKVQCNNTGFYQEWIGDGDGKYNIMFACHELIGVVVRQGITDRHADATFKVVPSSPRCRQLLIIHSIPVCCVLTESKTEVAYKKVIERFHAKFGPESSSSYSLPSLLTLHVYWPTPYGIIAKTT